MKKFLDADKKLFSQTLARQRMPGGVSASRLILDAAVDLLRKKPSAPSLGSIKCDRCRTHPIESQTHKLCTVCADFKLREAAKKQVVEESSPIDQTSISKDHNGEVKAIATGSSADPTDTEKSEIVNFSDDSEQDDDEPEYINIYKRIHIVVSPLLLFFGGSSERCKFVTQTDIKEITSVVREILKFEPVSKLK